MTDSDQRRGDAEHLPDGSASENSHEDTASGGVQPDDSDQDADDSRARDVAVPPDETGPGANP